MKAMRMFLFLMLLPVCGLFAGGGDPYPHLTQEQNAAFQNALQEQISLSEKLVQRAISSMATPGELHTVANKIDVDVAMTSLQVKQTLYQNFANKDSLRSPLVRNTLLGLFKQPEVTMSDLNNLQTVVNQEKQNIREWDREKQRQQSAAQPQPGQTQPIPQATVPPRR